ELLHTWQQVPGRGDKGPINTDALKEWVNRAREAAQGSGLETIVDERIGQILAYAPEGEDGAWPDFAVRELIEVSGNRAIERGVETGVYNQRGISTRSPTEGGRQE